MTYKQRLKRRTRGVPKGYEHNWKYTGHWKEKKKGKTWNIRFRATKTRGGGIGGLPIGSQVVWGIRAIQKARKTGKRKYQTDMIGKKRLLMTKVKGRWKRY